MMKRLLSALLCAAMILPLSGCGESISQERSNVSSWNECAIVKAAYPQQAQYPDYTLYKDQEEFYEAYEAWRKDQRDLNSLSVSSDIIEDFLRLSVPEFLTGTQGNEVYSPVNVYMALAMLAELTDGNSRAQIFEVLGTDNLSELREDAAKLWNTTYRNDGAVTSVLAASLWLDKDINYVDDTMEALAEHYYASSYIGEMGSEGMNRALRDWINEQTGGLLEEQAADLELPAETILALATTIYFRAKWDNEFNENRTVPGEFVVLSPDGGTIPCEFMNSSGTGNYYWAEQFSAVSRELKNNGRMWFILPDSETSVDALLDDPATMDFLMADGEWENSKFLTINLSVPKFDVSSNTDLTGGMKRLGMVDIFDPTLSDFGATTADMTGIILSRAEHAARVAIDEEGVTAAAYTVMMEAGAAMPPDEEVDFVLDRPFLFAITAKNGLPLFMGVVQDPGKN